MQGVVVTRPTSRQRIGASVDDQAKQMAYEIDLADAKFALYDLTDAEIAEARGLFPRMRRAVPVVRVGTGPLPTLMVWARPAPSTQ